VNIVVLVKQVPDSGSERKLDPADNTVDRASANNVINEMDEYAIEEALRLQEANGGEVTILTMGPEQAAESIRKALQTGSDGAVHVVDDALHGSDAVATSLALAKAVEHLGDVDLVLLGSESSDARMSVVPAMLAERLGRPQLTFAKEVTVGDGTVSVKRLTDDGYTVVEASLPAVVSVVEKINEPRYPSFKGIMAAKKKPVETLSLSDLGIEPGDVGLGGAWSAVESFEAAPPRQAGTVVKDEGGDGADKLVEFLASKKFV
jgi:electron transfer flavoprotein beta subunit